MDFLVWNDQIAKHFFRPEMAGRRIYLYVNEEVLNVIGSDKADLNDFISAVKVGPPGLTRSGLCQRALQTMQEWRSENLLFPPYLAYLALFVLAAGKEGDFAPHAYYPRLRTLLGEEPKSGQYPSFDHMVRLWDDLEQWSNKDRAGELGIFNNSIAGGWFHVGIPIAQTLLTEHERAVLPSIFARTAMDPNAPPSDEELAALVRRFGQHDLRPRTLTLLARKNESEEDFRGVLIETIVEELQDWDGTEVVESGSTENCSLNGTLRLCCQLDEVARVAHFSLRCSSKHDLPVDGLSLRFLSKEEVFVAEEYGLGWSTPLMNETSGNLLDAARFNWSEDLVLKDRDQEWTLRLSGAPVRVFVSGEQFGIHGLVEVRRLPQSSRFYMAARKESYERIKEWGEKKCRGFKDIDVQGLPDGWLFSSVDLALDDEGIRERYPMLSLPVTTRLFFKGGVRVAKGNQFFRFAPPRVVLQGRTDSIDVYCNDTILKYDHSEDCYPLPDDLPAGVQLLVEARVDGTAVKKVSCYLEEEFPALTPAQAKQFDQFGIAIPQMNSESGTVAGSLVNGTAFPAFEFGSALHSEGYESTFYLGRSPGQVASYPSEPLPQDWVPVWQVRIRRTGNAKYCGISLSNSGPMKQIEGTDHKKVQLWKDLLWHSRKRIVPPPTPNLRKLWRQYQEVAQHV